MEGPKMRLALADQRGWVVSGDVLIPLLEAPELLFIPDEPLAPDEPLGWPWCDLCLCLVVLLAVPEALEP